MDGWTPKVRADQLIHRLLETDPNLNNLKYRKVSQTTGPNRAGRCKKKPPLKRSSTTQTQEHSPPATGATGINEPAVGTGEAVGTATTTGCAVVATAAVGWPPVGEGDGGAVAVAAVGVTTTTAEGWALGAATTAAGPAVAVSPSVGEVLTLNEGELLLGAMVAVGAAGATGAAGPGASVAGVVVAAGVAVPAVGAAGASTGASVAPSTAVGAGVAASAADGVVTMSGSMMHGATTPSTPHVRSLPRMSSTQQSDPPSDPGAMGN